jgi:hypothetical protein
MSVDAFIIPSILLGDNVRIHLKLEYSPPGYIIRISDLGT